MTIERFVRESVALFAAGRYAYSVHKWTPNRESAEALDSDFRDVLSRLIAAQRASRAEPDGSMLPLSRGQILATESCIYRPAHYLARYLRENSGRLYIPISTATDPLPQVTPATGAYAQRNLRELAQAAPTTDEEADTAWYNVMVPHSTVPVLWTEHLGLSLLTSIADAVSAWCGAARNADVAAGSGRRVPAAEGTPALVRLVTTVTSIVTRAETRPDLQATDARALRQCMRTFAGIRNNLGLTDCTLVIPVTACIGVGEVEQPTEFLRGMSCILKTPALRLFLQLLPNVIVVLGMVSSEADEHSRLE